jgi:aminoglycoside phosphotransferase (APT) family kinase protein
MTLRDAPALETCTDAPAMRALLQDRLPGFAGGTLRIDELRVLKARRSASLYRNPNPITLCYELTVQDREHGNAGRQLLYGKVFRDGASAACFQSIDASRFILPSFGEPVAHLPELDMVLWALPNDPGLPQLARLLDVTQARASLPWAALGIDAAAGCHVDVEMLRYEPERRATLRYTLALGDRADPLVLYAKTFCDERGRAIDMRFDHFWTLAQYDAAAPLVAQPLGYDAATRTAWQAAAHGVPLADALANRDAQALLTRVARALAVLHAAPLASTQPRPTAHWVAEARRRQTKIARAQPALAGRAGALVDAIETLAAQLPSCPISLIHGDFHPEQVWLHDGRIVLFDFDEFTLGDPMEDVAAFVTRLESAGTSSLHASWIRSFVDAYAACAPEAFDRRRLQWHLAVQSLVQASRAFVYQQPGWALELERRLAHAEAHAAALQSGDLA